MTEQQAEYGIQKSDIGELQSMSAVTRKRNALIFNTRLDEHTIGQLAGILSDFAEGYQLYFSDMWTMLEFNGYEWTDYIPESVGMAKANRWRRIAKRFPVDIRLGHNHVTASHYDELITRKLSDEQAYQLIDHADKNGWTVAMVREAVKAAIGKEPPVPKPKAVVCPHCDRWMVEGQECFGCAYDRLYEELEAQKTANKGPEDDWK